ncbi:hypothetical protein HG536_0H01320 [Torulaspora globosa]|uniref:C3H1-type domain-containing protein n=1 Tax=Torulaspora globosa TaxID=48254 RepID=A0A7G3ZMM1_9SACH|nr:uncharacterized protein HG536_0H01320 [Torulaspora globosa]QLL34757.1 hypothetical protein HG536_0H01320 [Torulaspora globosa]
MGSPRQKDPAGSHCNSTGHYHGRHRRRFKSKKSSEPITTEVAPVTARPMFSPQQQKAIFEHQLITKNHAGQKAYAHVPCKFFRQGTCQAGDSCPFSHSLDASAADQTPCEYFRRGNCKFGSRCANAHVLPGASIDEEDEQEAEEDGVFPHDEQFYLPADFAELLAPERLTRRNSGSSMTSFSAASLGPSLSSASSSYTATAASPLLHQQLAYLHPSAKSFSPWSPPPNSRNSFSWLLGDLASLRIDEEEPLVYTDCYDATNTANLPDTQFLFDDLPDNTRF